MRADLHIHTLYSHDAVNLFTEIEEVALQRGIECIAITDHETIKGAEKAKRVINRVKVITGVEFYTEYGHLIGLNIERYPTNRRGMSFEELTEFISSEGGISILAHPLDKLRGGGRESIDKVIKYVDAIEVANSHDSKAEINYIILMKIAEDFKKGITAGSDSHIKDTVGYAYIQDDSDNLDQLIDNILNRNVVIQFRKVSFNQRAKKKFLEILHRSKLYRVV